MKKIVVIGPECTGKSTLTNALAQHYNAPYIIEYAREYINKLNRPYTQDDILEIAKKQIALEEEIKTSSNYLFCDTDLIVCKVWSEFKYGLCHPWIIQQITQRHYDYYLLCDVDLPWKNDKQREHPKQRQKLFNIYQKELLALNKPFSIINGRERTQSAIKLLEDLF